MKHLTTKMQSQFNKMTDTGKLFRVELSGEKIWDLYLKGFGSDPVFRDPEASVHNCNHCNNFIRRYGNIVAIDSDLNIMTIFDVSTTEEYQNTVDGIHKAILKSKVVNVFFETFAELQSLPYEACKKHNKVFRLGVDSNPKRYTKEESEKYGVVAPEEIITFEHFFLDIPNKFVSTSNKSIQSIMAEHRDRKEVFKRAMTDISLDTLNLVIDLINQGSLLDGTTHLKKVIAMKKFKEDFIEIPASKRDNWTWIASRDLAIAKFKNELIGVLCSELSEGEGLEKACSSWNKRVDPANYMKAVAPITKKQKEDAQKFVEDNGYIESFDRRHATLDDIKVTEIKHINVGDGSIKNPVSIFDKVKVAPTSRHKRDEFKGVEEVSIEKFMETILPTCSSVEAFVDNNHEGNFVNLTTTNQEDAKPIFKWDNAYSWTYKGNLEGKSQIKETVKSHGGKVDGVLRFSIMWAGGDGDESDLDAHCIEPSNNKIYFSSKNSLFSGGSLDIDIQRPSRYPKGAVENITFPSIGRMPDGTYKMLVHQYSRKNSKGFKAEIEFNGEVHEYSYNKPVSGYVTVAEVTLKNGEFSIRHILPSTSAKKEIYGIDTKQFHKVNLVCLSPNHWGDNESGNKHYLFMLDGCKADVPLRSFHSANLLPELATHRKVLEVLAGSSMVEPDQKQLAGLGFNSTVKDEILLKLGGSHKRVIKVKF